MEKEKINDSGQAFPRVYGFSYADGSWEYVDEPGMSLRMYIAVHAMQGLLASNNYSHAGWELLVKNSFEISDSMLEEERREE